MGILEAPLERGGERERSGYHECLDTPQGLGVQELLWALAGRPLPTFSMSLGFWKALWLPRSGSFTGEVATLWFERKSCLGNECLDEVPLSEPTDPPTLPYTLFSFLLGER